MDYDALIVGCGHNGLVAAYYLAAGLKVVALERRNKVGGACATDELFPGYHFSTCAQSFVLFHPKFVQDMGLQDHGLQIYPRNPNSFHPYHSGKYLLFWADVERTVEAIGRISRHDAAAYPRWLEFWTRAVAIWEPFLLREAPSFTEFARCYEGTAEESLLYKMMFGTVRSLLNEFFESEEVKSALVAPFDSGSTDAPGALLYWAFHASLSHQVAASTGIGYPRGGWGPLRKLCGRLSRHKASK